MRTGPNSYEVNGDQYVAIITDTRDDEPLHRSHVENGKRVAVPEHQDQMGPWQPDRARHYLHQR